MHSCNYRIYYEDTDAGGIVYHANFLNYAERGRTEMLRSLGHSNIELQKDPGLLFIVRKATVDYLSPGFLEDDLEIHTSVTEMRNTSLILKQSIFRPKDDTLLCDTEIVLVCVGTNLGKDGGPKHMKPIRIPDTVRKEFETYLN